MKTLWMLLLFISTSPLYSQEKEEQKLIIIRHGQATNNLDNIYNSNPDNPNYKPASLTNKGKKEANQAASKLLSKGFKNENIVAVIVSPLPRAKETAEILVQNGLITAEKIKVDNRLIEQQAGDLEGKPIFSIWKRSYSEEYKAENEEQLKKRMNDFYQSLLKEYPEGNIIVITHSVPSQVLLQQVINRPFKLSTGEAKVVPLRKQ